LCKTHCGLLTVRPNDGRDEYKNDIFDNDSWIS
jgi:hypothetical protein